MFRRTRAATTSRPTNRLSNFGRKHRFDLLNLESRIAPATVTVTNNLDDLAVDGSVSIREALASINGAANINADVVAVGAYGTSDSIDFSGVISPINLTAVNGGQLAISKAVTITGPGSGLLTIANTAAASTTSRIFNDTLASGLVAISGLTLSGGNLTTGNGGGIIMTAAGSLTLTDIILTANTAASEGGGISNQSTGTLTVQNSTISLNKTTGANDGGGINNQTTGVVILTNSTVSGNNSGSDGGAIYMNSGGTLTVTGSTLTGNTAAARSGGVYMFGAAGVWNFTSSTISLNKALAGVGGGLDLHSGTMTVSGCLITGNSTSSTGGGIQQSGGTANVSGSIITSNTANTNGGGINTSTTFNLNSTTIDGNLANVQGGGINSSSTFNIIPPAGNSGVTISNNSAPLGGGWNMTAGTVTVRNTTIAKNTATGALGGGGINVAGATLNLQNSTVAINAASNAAGVGGGFRHSSGTVNISSSIVSDNTALGVGGVDGHSTVGAGINIAGNDNLIGVDGATDNITYTGTGQFNVASGLDTASGLQLNGAVAGTPFTIALLGGSLAINTGNNLQALTTDQRGGAFPRLQGAGADVGAFESPDPAPIVVSATAPDVTVAGGTKHTVTVTYKDLNGSQLIDSTTLGTGDITVNGPFAFTTNPTIMGSYSDAQTIAVTYEFTAPDNTVIGTWDGSDNGTYTITMNVNQVYDKDGTPIPVPNGDVGSFKATMPLIYTVDEVLDENDGIYTALQFSLREAIGLANTDGVPSIIQFDPAVFSGATTIDLSGVGSDLVISDAVTINGPTAAMTIKAAGSNRIFNTSTSPLGAKINFSRMILTGGSTTGNGGAIQAGDESITLDTVALRGNSTTGSGGGIGFTTGGLGIGLTIINSEISGNTGAGGGGAWVVGINQVAIRNSTFSGNTASSNYGGAFAGTSWSPTGSFIMTNSVMTLNKTLLASNGGAIRVTSGGAPLNIESSAITGNTGSVGSPQIYAGVVNLTTSLVSSKSGFTLGTNVGNLADATAPGWAALNAYGGITLTHGLLPGSALIDVGSNPATLLTDQRGATFPRQVGAAVDIGAFEGVLPIPAGTLTPLGPIVIAGATPDTVDVVYTDDTGILVSSIDIADIEILDPALAPLTILSVSVNPPGNGTPRTATYKFAVPVNSLAGWDGSDNGTYTVNLFANEITDTDGSPNKNIATALGTFKVAVPAAYLVDEVSDVDDLDYTVGKLSIREAILQANGDAAPSVISFDPAVFNTTKTIALASGQLDILEGVTITGPAVGLILDPASRIFNVDVATPGDAVSISNITADGGTVTGGNGGGILNVDAALTLTNVTVSNCTTDGEGGGISISSATGSLTLINCNIINNKATGAYSNGGGVDLRGGSTVIVTNSTVSGNSAGEDGGGIYFFSGGTLTMSGSTVSGNVANTKTTSSGGGGMYLFNTVTVISNSTISGNTAKGAGGGIGVFSIANTTVKNSTIAFNVVTGNGGGIANAATITSTILANNTATGVGPDGNGTLTANFSLISNTTGATVIGASNQLNVAAGLSSLNNFGGLTATHGLLPGSAAINAGDNPDLLSTDQRGATFPRLVGPQTDIGAFEGVLAIPAGALTPLGPIVTPGATPNTLDVVYTDDTGIDVTTIGITDIEILDPSLVPLNIVSVVFNPAGNGTPRTATYTFDPPGLAWDGADNGTYTVKLKAGAIADIDTNVNFASTLGTFSVAIPISYLVDEVSDVDDLDYTVGKLSLREAILQANGDAAPSVINFDNTVFNTVKTIAVGLELAIAEGVSITGPTVGLILGPAANRVFSVDVTTGGDAVSISNMTVDGAVLTGGNGGGILNVDAALTLTNVTVSNCTTDGEGGGISVSSATGSLTLINCNIINNKATSAYSNGGGVDLRGGSTVIVTNSTVSGNSAGEDGGGIYFFSGGTLTMSGSTVSGNVANTTTTSAGGGGMYLFSTVTVISNSTISGNTAKGAGGGIGVFATANTTVKNSTIAFNVVTGNGGGIANAATITSTILANNTATAVGPDGNGTLTANFSLISNTTGATVIGASNQLNVAAGLSSLNNFGGLTETHGLLPGSAAINAGDNPDLLSTDQRGATFPRLVGPQTDIGAFEGVLAIPAGALTPLGPIVTPGATPNTLDVVYTDDTGIDVTTIGITDIEILDPSLVPLNIVSVVFNPAGNGTPRTATYTFDPPGLAWDGADNGTYTVKLKAGAIADIDTNVNFASTLGTFSVVIPISYLVDEVSDLDDLNYTVGNLSLREAISLANGDAQPSLIDFSNTIGTFGSPQSITVVGEYAITQDVTIKAPTALLTLNGGAANRLFNTTGSVSISGMRLTNGFSGAAAHGGAVLVTSGALTLNNCTVDLNTADLTGGGIRVTGSASVILNNSTVADNDVPLGGGLDSGDGGGISAAGGTPSVTLNNSTVSGNSAVDDGGGIYFFTGGTLNVTNSTISGNTAGAGDGGGMYLWSNSATIVNSTISGNVTGGIGGGIANLSSATVNAKNSTVAFNTAGTYGGGFYAAAGTNTIESTIVSNNTATLGGNDVYGTMTANFSLLSDSVGVTISGASNVLDVDPALAALAANGGPTQTHAITNASPAYNVGSNVNLLSFDQRGAGFARNSGGGPDMGAYELQVVANPPTVTTLQIDDGSIQRSMIRSLTVTFSESVVISGAIADAFQLNRDSTPPAGPNAEQGGVTGLVNIAAVQAGNTVTITFLTSGANPINGVFPPAPGANAGPYSLPDGRYTLTIDASKVTGAGGKLDGDGNLTGGDNYVLASAASPSAPTNIFRFFGDVTGDGAVAGSDFNGTGPLGTPPNVIGFKSVFNGSDGRFDYDQDGSVSAYDFVRFRFRFNGSVP